MTRVSPVLAVLLMMVTACQPQRRPDTTTNRGPQPNDSLVKLIRKQFTDSNPRQVHLQVLCEGMRLHYRHGYAEGDRLSREAWARAWDSRDKADRYRVEKALLGHDYSINQAICDSVSRATQGSSPDSTP